MEQRAPFSFSQFPVAIAPARFGTDALPVVIDAATIGGISNRRPKPDRGLLTGVAEALRVGQAKRDGRLIRVFDPASRLFLEMERSPGAWRIRAVFRARPSYFAGQPGEDF